MGLIFAIESSCDETSASICKNGKILSNYIANQTIHEKYGGVVPELASRAHLQNIVPVIDAALKTTGCALKTVNAFAFTQSPGLIGSLLVGAQFAKSLSLAFDKPLIAVHHMHAHVLANLIEEPAPTFPFLCLTVSGGHTQIVLARAELDFTVIGETIDDAAGEAFDKCGKLFGLPYPAGPSIDNHALMGNPHAFKFTEPKVPNLDFSFSGLKTSVLYFLRDKIKDDLEFIEKHLNDLCASVQYTIINILLKNLKKAVKQTGIKQVCLAGGVSANSGLRKALQETGNKEGWQIFIPSIEYCTDNAAMIAITGYYKFLAGEFADLSVSPSARAGW
jgi:N6-L-threonylcarbamoyladenine synthase